MFLCNLYQPLAQTQINLVLLAKGVDKVDVGGIISAFSISMVIGRFLCGAAIDRLPGHLVAAVGMGMPCIGLFMLAAGVGTTASATVSMIFIGLAVGAEGDLIGVLVARAFGVVIYGSVMGLVTGSISMAVATGALLLSTTLGQFGTYDAFLFVTATTVLIGALMFLLLPRAPAVALGGLEPKLAS